MELWDLYDREKGPLKWECVGGSALMGEDSLSAALWEVQEEVGFALNPNRGKVVRTMLRERFQDIVDVWLCRLPIPCPRLYTTGA